MSLQQIDDFTIQAWRAKRELVRRNYTLCKCNGKPFWFILNRKNKSFALEYDFKSKKWLVAAVSGSETNASAIRFFLNNQSGSVQ